MIRTLGHRTQIFAVLALGIGLRLYQFPDNPPGLYSDEAYAGYDAFSLLHTGADQWQVPLPVYFISSGSGQSVLYSYLSIPIISVFGLTRFSIRLLSLFTGILTLPLLYIAARRALGRRAAIISMLMLAIMPWHVMISRWALDANLLPFFLLLGIYTTLRATDEFAPRMLRRFALVPWSLSLYAYALAIVVMPILLLFFLLVYRSTIQRKLKSWLVACALFGLISAPILLFFVKNFVLRDEIGIESLIPFGIPILPFSRWEHVTSPLPDRLVKNLFFVLNAFQDGEVRNMVIGMPPTYVVLFPLAIVALLFSVKSRKPNPFALWLAAGVPLFFVTDAEIHRVNAIFIPLTVIGVFGFLRLTDRLREVRKSYRGFACGVAVLLAIQAATFSIDYFLTYPTSPDTEIAFFKGFDRALRTGSLIIGPSEAILVTDQVGQSYLLTAMYSNYPPENFQREVERQLTSERVHIPTLGRFYFGLESLPDHHARYAFVLGKWEPSPCEQPRMFLETRLWKVGRCD